MKYYENNLGVHYICSNMKQFTTAFDESILKISVKNRWASAKLFWPRWRNALESKWHINEFSSKTQGNNTFKKEWTPFFIFPVTDVSVSDICSSQCEGDADLQTNGMTTWITQLLYFLPMKATVFINLNADTLFPELFLHEISHIIFRALLNSIF